MQCLLCSSYDYWYASEYHCQKCHLRIIQYSNNVKYYWFEGKRYSEMEFDRLLKLKAFI